MARLVGIALRPAPHGPMQETASASITAQGGLADDPRGRPGPRQVTVVAKEAWRDACSELGRELPWTLRRANLLVEGVPLAESTGMRLRIGQALLEITGETRPCHVMDAQQTGLRRALETDWRGGVCCRVLDGGTVALGDDVSLEGPS